LQDLIVPPTVVCEDSSDALAAFERLGGDVVVKPIFGSEGRGIVRIISASTGMKLFWASWNTLNTFSVSASDVTKSW